MGDDRRLHHPPYNPPPKKQNTWKTKQTIVTAVLPAAPAFLHVNPRLAAVLTLDMECEEGLLGATARRATDVPSRIWAYEQLIREAGTPSAMRLVRRHVAAEAFWGVRVAVGEALSDAPSNAGAAILVRWI